MRLTDSSSVAARLVVLDRVGSTNAELARRLADEDPSSWPAFSALVTTDQTAGRGRRGRTWTAAPGQALAASVLVRPQGVPVAGWGWYPLIAGLAMADTVTALLPDAEALVKWPNDVLVHDRKLCGILAEVLPRGDALVIGAGVNLTMRADSLPTPTATSLAVEGVEFDGDDLVDRVLAEWLRGLRTLCGELADAGGDPDSSDIRSRVVARCGTIGRRVRVDLPDRSALQGTAVGIDRHGGLQVRADDGVLASCSAGDVTHLRYE